MTRSALRVVLGFAVLAAIPFAGAGCLVHGTTATYAEVDLGPPPPPRRVYVVERPGYVWVDGYWYPSGSTWAWREGYYVHARPGYTHVQGYYTNRGGRYVYVSPRWQPIQERRRERYYDRQDRRYERREQRYQRRRRY